MAEPLDLYRATEEEWAAHVTAAYRHNPLQCVLPVTKDPDCNLLNFAQGSLGGGGRNSLYHHRGAPRTACMTNSS